MDMELVHQACSEESPVDFPEPTVLEVPARPELGSAPVATLDAFQQIIDALPEAIALVDSDWTIVAVNQAWVSTAKTYGYTIAPGDNYLRFCEEKGSDGHKPAGIAAAGIRAMEGSGESSFRYIYSGHGAWEGRSFQLCINRIEIGGRPFATVTRYDVTELVNLRHMREDFASTLMAAQDQERRRIAQEVHDSTMQLLASLGLSLGQLRRIMRSKAGAEIAGEMQEVLGEAQRELRAISYLAYPPQLKELGLVGALKQLAGGFARRTDLKIDFHADKSASIAPSAQAAVYRTVQEALSNAHRHAQATHVTVGLYLRHSCLHVVIADNGKGLPVRLRQGVGLPSMRARVEELGGRMRIRGGHPGTVVTASFPLNANVRAVGDLALNAGRILSNVVPLGGHADRSIAPEFGWDELRAS
jgi:signal transduction histidine kinase